MSTAKRLALIAAGYVLAVVAGFAAVTVNELRMPADVAQGSPGMVAFGDMILFVLVAGFVGLAPTWFLLKLFIEKAPRALLAIVLLVAAMGPVSWLAVTRISAASMPMLNDAGSLNVTTGCPSVGMSVPRRRTMSTANSGEYRNSMFTASILGPLCLFSLVCARACS